MSDNSWQWDGFMEPPQKKRTDMKWGVFDRRESFDKAVHVAPCDENGMISGGHRILVCDCQPRTEQYGEFVLVTHRQDS